MNLNNNGVLEKIKKIFGDKRFTNAMDRYVEDVNQASRVSRDRQSKIYGERRELDRERQLEIDAIQEKYRPRYEEMKNRIDAEIAKQVDRKGLAEAKAEKLIKKRIAKAIPIIEKDLEGNPMAGEVEPFDENGIRIGVKPVMVNRRGTELYPTTGYIILRFNLSNKRIEVENMYSDGKPHPHGTCLNTNAWNLASDGRFSDAVLDLSMALAVAEH